MRHLRQRSRQIKSMDASQQNAQPYPGDVILTTSMELSGLYFLNFALGPAMNVIYVFLPLLIATTGRLLAAQNEEGIEWRRVFAGGDICHCDGEDSYDPSSYVRPACFPEECVWFPKNPSISALDVHFASFAAFCLAAMLLLSGMAIWILGHLTQKPSNAKIALATGLVAFPALTSIVIFASENMRLWQDAIIAVCAGAILLFTSKAALQEFFFLLIASHPDVAGIESCTAQESPNTVRSMPTIGNMSGEGRFSSRRTYSTMHAYHDSMEDLVSVLLTMVTPRGNFRRALKPRPECVPRLDLSSVQEMEPPKAAPAVINTARLAKMEWACGESFDDAENQKYGKKFNFKSGRHAVEGTLTNAGNAELLGQGLGLLLQCFVMIWIGWVAFSSILAPYQAAIFFSSLWGWVFGSMGFTRLGTNSIVRRSEGTSYQDGAFGTIKSKAMVLRSMKESLVDLWNLRIAGAVLMVAVRTLQSMGGVFALTEFGFDPFKMILVILAYALVVPFSTLVSYLLVWLSKEPAGKLAIVKTYLFAMLLLPLCIGWGVQSQHELFLLLVAGSFFISPISAILSSLQSDMVPTSCLYKVLSTDCLLESLLWWLGPLMVGCLVEFTGSIRFGLAAVSGIVSLAIPFVLHIDISRALGEVSGK